VQTAIEAAHRFMDYHPRWLEEPRQWYDDWRAMRMPRQHTHIPFASGENAQHRFDA
jgi:L-alanine-DL-glutamate epimerase-like enolase superfamily enzyme